jgi:Ca-activated chloride channel family protein
MKYPHSRSLRVVLCSWIALALLAAVTLGQNPPPHVPSQPQDDDGIHESLGRLVMLSATVTDDHDRPVTTLTVKDFTVFEDKVSQKLAYWLNCSKTDCPMSVAILLDLSNSLRLNPLSDEVRNGLARFAKETGAEEYALLGFRDQIEMLVDWTKTPEALADALNRPTKPGGYTALYDAVAATVEWLNKRKTSRHALIVISDGWDTASHRSPEQVEEVLKHSDVTLYSVALNKGPTVLDDPFAETHWNVLRRLAAPTAGRFVLPRSAKDVREAFDRIADELRHQYLVGYWPINTKEDGKWRRVKVSVQPVAMKDPSAPDKPAKTVELKVRAREGYYYRPSRER